MEDGRNLGRRLGVPAMLLLAAVALGPAPAQAAPAIEQYVLDLPDIDRPDAGGAAIDPVRTSSAGGVAGEDEQPISGLESLLDALSEPLGVGLLAVLLGAGAIALRRRLGEGRPA